MMERDRAALGRPTDRGIDMSYTDEHMEQANAMLDAADGFADDELVWFAGHQWSACLLRERADEIIDALT